jgi:tRNA threonylcarbamoyladenosine biosynthesis protein TsaB
MPNILMIESATKVCSVALLKGEEIFLNEESSENFSHAEKLTVFVENVLKEAHLKPTDLDAVAVSSGPGSYTGLRIGVSLAKGLCYSLNIPLISVDTLQYLANNIELEKNELACAMIDARRMEVYFNVFDNENKALFETNNKVIEENSFSDLMEKNKLIFVGDGTEKCSQIIKNQNAVFLAKELCSAPKMKNIALDKFLKKDFEDVAYFVPFYLKNFIPGKSTKSVFG